MSNLLKESIADAKAVRETAIANAKTFLEENFAKSMKEMFAEKLKEESDQVEETTSEAPVQETAESVEEDLNSSDIGKDSGNMASDQRAVEPSAAASKNTVSPGSQEYDASLEEVEEPVAEGEEVEVEEESDEITSEELDEIIAELEGEVSESAEEPVAEEAVAEEAAAEEDAAEETVEEEINLDELLAELENESVEEGHGTDHDVAAIRDDEDQISKLAKDAGEDAADMANEEISSEEMAEALLAINEENDQLKQELEEHQKTVKYLKGVLEETNLLNAKLLFTNKLFKGKNLTESQKLKVINTFDLTKSLREVKLAYAVLAESFNAGGSVAKKKSNATVSTITEGLASKPVQSTKPEAIVEPEVDVMTSRFQKLAGIVK